MEHVPVRRWLLLVHCGGCGRRWPCRAAKRPSWDQPTAAYSDLTRVLRGEPVPLNPPKHRAEPERGAAEFIPLNDPEGPHRAARE